MKTINKLMMIILIFMIFSINNLGKYTDDFLKQIIFFGIGFLLLFIIRHISLNKIYKLIMPLYIVLNILLLYLLLFGSSINGSKAWIDLKFITFQPSEFMKIILLLLLARMALYEKHFIKKGFIITLIPSILTFLEPDTGNVLFYIIIYLSLVFYQSKDLKNIIYMMILIIILGLTFLGIYFYNQGLFIKIFGSSFFYRMDRITELFTSSYQLEMGLINMGKGGLWGSSLVSNIPEGTTDFAFSLLVSLTGIGGALVYLLCHVCLMLLLIKHITKTNNRLGEYITFAFLAMYFMQSSIHLLMNVGLFPITGITLPFISYGGSSLLSYFLILGIINNYYMDSN